MVSESAASEPSQCSDDENSENSDRGEKENGHVSVGARVAMFSQRPLSTASTTNSLQHAGVRMSKISEVSFTDSQRSQRPSSNAVRHRPRHSRQSSVRRLTGSSMDGEEVEN